MFEFEVDIDLRKESLIEGYIIPVRAGASGRVVLNSSSHLGKFRYTGLFDNFFYTPEVIDYLHAQNLLAISTP